MLFYFYCPGQSITRMENFFALFIVWKDVEAGFFFQKVPVWVIKP
jgi:hypothetical protein